MYIDVSNVSISFEENKEQHTILNDVSLQVEKENLSACSDRPAAENPHCSMRWPDF